jgi:hypothetical protein
MIGRPFEFSKPITYLKDATEIPEKDHNTPIVEKVFCLNYRACNMFPWNDGSPGHVSTISHLLGIASSGYGYRQSKHFKPYNHTSLSSFLVLYTAIFAHDH